ncbi:MAG: L-ribulose-5-phosphate 4-epimerase AraD [Clostridia bacterium]|nr:L-ribulose-5-phosphate 4-epimerase AraD [Clostridia bacterium]
MTYESLRRETYLANMELKAAGLIVLTWGNASQADREAGVFAIKPSGVSYDALRPEDIVVCSLESGEKIDGDMRPSSDTPTHFELYRSFGCSGCSGCIGGIGGIGGVVHTHSRHAVAWAQAKRDIPCYGTTHADVFCGSVPCARELTDDEIGGEYELCTGKVIAETYRERGIDPLAVPGVLVACHGPFTWGKSAMKAVENAITLEEAALMAFETELLSGGPAEPVKKALLDKHYLRKHGENAYYGQK